MAIDTETLEELHTLVQARVARLDRRRRNQPLHEALQQRMKAIMNDIVPNLTAGTTADSRKSVLAMEESIERFPERLAAMEEKNAANLARVKERTAVLRGWLEALS